MEDQIQGLRVALHGASVLHSIGTDNPVPKPNSLQRKAAGLALLLLVFACLDLSVSLSVEHDDHNFTELVRLPS